MEWPPHFPPACPPAESSDAKADVYRIVKGRKPAERDSVSYWFLYPSRREKALEVGDSDEACRLCGLSVFLTLEDIKRVQRRIPHLGKGIAVGHLNGQGKLLDTGKSPGHHTWWIPSGLEKPWTLFKIVA